MGLVGLVAALGCSANSGGSEPGGVGPAGSAGAGDAPSAGGVSNAGGEGGGLNVGGQGPSSGGSAGSQTCASSTVVAKPVETNLFISFDKSGSMDSDNKWHDTTLALESFFQDPGTDGLRVAMRFFGDDLPLGAGCAQMVCNLAACAIPNVDIGTLLAAPNDTHELALINAIQVRKPGGGGGTPIHPALHGATTWAKNYKAGHPADVVAVILVTDGKPEGCIQDINTIAGVAAEAFSGSGIRTYSIGLAGSEESTMNKIAQAGGTGQAFFINGGNVTQALLDALKKIQGESSLPCQFAMPQGNAVDPTKVNVEHTTGNGSSESIGQVADSTGCGSVANGWYYDDPNAPSSIVFCPQTCSAVQGDPGGKVDIQLGCETVLAQPK